jgi:hypothetical protein
MLWKLFTLALILGFAWWRVRQFLRLRRLRERGEPIPPPQGLRPISLLAGFMLLLYGGYLLYVLAQQVFFHD